MIAEIGAAVAHELYGKTYVPIHDRQGNVSVLLDQNGNIAETYRYDAFGNETIYTDTPTNNPWRFSSKRVDEETGFVYFGRRYYGPSLGKWLTQDPLGLKAGPNLYAYVLNNPLTLIDLYGLFEQDEHAQVDARNEQSNNRNSEGICEGLVSYILNGVRELLRDEMRGDFVFDALEHYEQEQQNLMEHEDVNDLNSELDGAGQDRILSDIFLNWLGDRLIDVALGKSGKRLKPSAKPSVNNKNFEKNPAKAQQNQVVRNSGRGKNNVRPDPNAEGNHSVYKRDPNTGKVTHYETYEKPSDSRDEVVSVDWTEMKQNLAIKSALNF